MTVAELRIALRHLPGDLELGIVITTYSDDSFKVEPLADEKRLFVYAQIAPVKDE